MPGFNKRGHLVQGSGTGRGMGPCRSKIKTIDQVPDTVKGVGKGGQPYGCGKGRCRGGGRGKSAGGFINWEAQ
jgi:hypothetical protein